MTNNNYYEWNERFLNSRASDNIIDDLNIDQSVDIDWDVEQTFSGGIDLSGNTIQKVGGTTDASSGSIRLANNSYIQSRDSGDSGDIRLIGAGGGDQIFIGDQNTLDIRFVGNSLTQVGGTTDASSGAIRLGNGSTINARNSGDSGDFGISFTSSDTISMDTAQNLRPTSEPSTPTSGTHLFVDSSDDNLKAKTTDGDVITVVTT